MNKEFWRDRRVFLTGHTGFKGIWLQEWLVHNGVSHTGYALPSDIRDSHLLQARMQSFEPDIVIHFAAQSVVKFGYEDPLETLSVNAQGTATLLDAVRRVQSVKTTLVVTSDKVYDHIPEHGGTPYTEDSALGGHDPYSASKACAEHIASAFARSYSMNIVTARAGNVIGSGDKSAYRLIPNILRSKEQSTPIRIFNPEAIRPWQHVLDCLTGYLALAEAAFTDKNVRGAWNFGPDEHSTTVLDVVKLFDCPYKIVPPEFVETDLLLLDSTKARERLGWKPKLSTAIALKWTKRGYESQEFTYRKQIEEYMEL